MSFPPFSSLKHHLITISFFVILLVLLLLKFLGYNSFLLSSTLILLVIPTSLPFIYSRIKPPTMSLMEEAEPASEPDVVEECKAAQEEGSELSDELPSLVNDNIISESSISDENCCSVLKNSYCSAFEDEASSEMGDSDQGFMSDDESLIEIVLEDEPNAVCQEELKGGLLPEFFPEFSLELLFRKHGLLELLSEINEEDNMIEIDIAMGSIKCSRVQIKA